MIVFRCIIFMLFVSVYQCRLPDKVYCVNDQCSGKSNDTILCHKIFCYNFLSCYNATISEPISKAKTLLDYQSADPDVMSFKQNAEALIFMKSAGTNPDLWFARINGQSGFVSSKFLRENKIFVKDPKIIKLVEDKRVPPRNVEPNKVQKPHEVIEGTTIYTTEATPSMPSQESLPLDAAQQGVKENIVTPSLETVNQGSIPQQQALPVSDQSPNEGTAQANNIPTQDNVLNQHPSVKSPEIIPNSAQQPKTTLPTLEALPNNVVESQETASSQHTQQETIKQEVVKNNVNEARYETEPTLEVVPQPQALLSSSGNSIAPETILQVPEKTTLIPETPTQPETQESEQNISVNSVNNVETPMTNDVSSETKQVPNMNVVASNKPELIPPLDKVPDLSQPDNTESQKIASSEVLPPENLNGDSAEQLGVSQESVKDTEQTTPQMQDFSTTTELPVTSHYNHETTYNSEETTATSSETTLTSSDTTETVQQFSTTESPSEQVTTPVMSEISSNNQYSTINEQTTETIQTSTTTETPTEQVHYESTTEEITYSTTESTQDENTEGFLTNVYSTIADLWPSTTEAPPTTESIFNAEVYSEPLPKEDLDVILETMKEPDNPHHIYHSDATRKPEIPNENADEKEFSFLNYFTLAYLSVLGGGEQTNALFASPGIYFVLYFFN